MLHNFNVKLAQGAAGEATLDALFSRQTMPTSFIASTVYGGNFAQSWADGRYYPRPVSMAEQRRGIDRFFTDALKVEYKTDTRAADTHNVFIETISVDRVNKPGWAYSSAADVLAYYIPGDDLVYVVRLVRLRRFLPGWERRYPVRKAQNVDYDTHGLCVPIEAFEAIADVVVSL